METNLLGCWVTLNDECRHPVTKETLRPNSDGTVRGCIKAVFIKESLPCFLVAVNQPEVVANGQDETDAQWSAAPSCTRPASTMVNHVIFVAVAHADLELSPSSL